MEFEQFSIEATGFVHCKSSFYSSHNTISENNVIMFCKGVNEINCKIDSDIWAATYLLSMYSYRPKDFNMYSTPIIKLDGKEFSFNNFSKHCCYLDGLYPLFSGDETVCKLMREGLARNNLEISETEKIKNIFQLDNERYDRPLSGVGNEKFRAMAAIGVANGKQIFCFPWMSKKRFEQYGLNLSYAINILLNLDKTIILPIGC